MLHVYLVTAAVLKLSSGFDNTYNVFTFGIQSASGLIQDKNTRVADESSCNGNPLFLSP